MINLIYTNIATTPKLYCIGLSYNNKIIQRCISTKRLNPTVTRMCKLQASNIYAYTRS